MAVSFLGVCFINSKTLATELQVKKLLILVMQPSSIERKRYTLSTSTRGKELGNDIHMKYLVSYLFVVKLYIVTYICGLNSRSTRNIA